MMLYKWIEERRYLQKEQVFNYFFEVLGKEKF